MSRTFDIFITEQELQEYISSDNETIRMLAYQVMGYKEALILQSIRFLPGRDSTEVIDACKQAKADAINYMNIKANVYEGGNHEQNI
jgi:hypothetical protein